MPFEKAAAGADGLSIVAHETERDVYIMKEMVGAAGKISLWIGPEGGFAPDEIEKLRQAGAHVVTLGRRILRAETAAMAAVAQILLLCEGASV
jgi:16S rRNA (uracil1498-N3)-methyltransferase